MSDGIQADKVTWERMVAERPAAEEKELYEDRYLKIDVWSSAMLSEMLLDARKKERLLQQLEARKRQLDFDMKLAMLKQMLANPAPPLQDLMKKLGL
jgi:hypothetical protein